MAAARSLSLSAIPGGEKSKKKKKRNAFLIRSPYSLLSRPLAFSVAASCVVLFTLVRVGEYIFNETTPPPAKRSFVPQEGAVFQ